MEIKDTLEHLFATQKINNGWTSFSEKECKELSNYINDLHKEIENYKSRIEKAVEYIKEDMYSEPNELYGLIDGEHLLNILNGKE